MGQVIWSSGALEDIDSIASFIARDSPDHSAMFVQKLLDEAEELIHHPRKGRVILELGLDDCREIIVGYFRLMYRVRGENVYIMGVVHGARDWPNPPRKRTI